ncbi:MAG TPA: sensor histidine kinase [Candidatus Limnocylindrales bacterium]|nr:sensor histidine kinase [Candidatus Limnocylindrales bacterium]
MRRLTALNHGRVRSALFDLLVGAGVAGVTSLGFLATATPRATMALGYLMAVAIVFRRRRPLATMAAVSVVALLQVILFPQTFTPLPYDVAVLVAMYSVVKYGKHIRDAYLAAAVVAIGIALVVARHPQSQWQLETLWYVGVCGGVWLMGYSMRNRRIYVATLEEKAATLEREREHLARIAVADERATIARELHDVVAHSLSVMIVQADGGRYAFDSDPDQARQALTTVAETGREALADMRRLVEVLRSTQVEPDGADARITVALDHLDQLVERARSAGVTVDVEVTGQRPPLPPAVEVSLYRIVQEALTNVLRHAGAGAHVRLRLRYTPEAVSVSVIDDGGEATVRSAAHGSGHGLVGMRERVHVHGGELTVGPAEAGWAVEATIPLRAAAIAA